MNAKHKQDTWTFCFIICDLRILSSTRTAQVCIGCACFALTPWNHGTMMQICQVNLTSYLQHEGRRLLHMLCNITSSNFLKGFQLCSCLTQESCWVQGCRPDTIVLSSSFSTCSLLLTLCWLSLRVHVRPSALPHSAYQANRSTGVHCAHDVPHCST